jgi:hypothetical protein
MHLGDTQPWGVVWSPLHTTRRRLGSDAAYSSRVSSLLLVFVKKRKELLILIPEWALGRCLLQIRSKIPSLHTKGTFNSHSRMGVGSMLASDSFKNTFTSHETRENAEHAAKSHGFRTSS